MSAKKFKQIWVEPEDAFELKKEAVDKNIPMYKAFKEKMSKHEKKKPFKGLF